MHNRIADLEKTLRESAQKFGITLQEKTLLPYVDEQGIQHYIIPDLLYEEGEVKIAIEIGGEYADREKNDQRHFKDEILKKMGYTVVSLDIEKGHEDQIGAFVDELRWMIMEQKTSQKAELPEYLTSSFSLKDKLHQKIVERKMKQENHQTSEKEVSSSEEKEKALLAEKNISKKISNTDPDICVDDLLCGKKIELPDPKKEEVSIRVPEKSSRALTFFVSALSGSVLTLALFGALYFRGLPESVADLQQFSADLLGQKNISIQPVPMATQLKPGKILLTNDSDGPREGNILLMLPAHSTFQEREGAYVLFCLSGFEKAPDGKNCQSVTKK